MKRRKDVNGIWIELLLLCMSDWKWLQQGSLFVSSQPRDTVAFINQSTFFNCSTTSPEILWYHYPVGSDEGQGRSFVYGREKFYDIYVNDFEIDKFNVNGVYFYNLIISIVKEHFAGKYECRDNNGLGAIHSAHLIIIDSDPTCGTDSVAKRVIGQNDCGLKSNELQLSCSITFYGNIHPTLKWTNDKQTSDSFNVTHELSHNQITYNVSMTAANNTDDAIFTCQTTQLVGEQQSCTSTVKVLYALNSTVKVDRFIDDEVNCSVNTNSHSCLYRWILYHEDHWTTVSNNSVMKLKNPGIYQCEAICYLLDKKCLISGINVNASVITTDEVPVKETSGAVIAVIIVVIIVLILVLVCLLFFIKRRRKQRANSLEYENELMIGSNHSDKNAPPSQPGEFKDLNRTNTNALTANSDCSKKTPEMSTDKAEDADPKTTDAFIAKNYDEDKSIKRKRSECSLDEENPEESSYQNVKSISPNTFKAMESNNFGKPITGIALLNKELFILFENSSTVEVFQTITFEFEHSFTVANLNKPLDVVSCPAENCLVVYSLGKNSSGEIFKMDSFGRVLLSWETYEAMGCLSVSYDSNVILSIRESGLLKEYSANGHLINDVELPSNIRPFHAMKVTDSEFFISYEMDEFHGICLVNSNGEILRNFSERLAFPKYLLLTSDGKYLIVDSQNSRVLLLDQTFMITEFLTSEDGLNRPVRICSDDSSGVIFVADNGDRNPRVMVFSLMIDGFT